MFYKRAGTEELPRAVAEDLTPAQYKSARLGFFGLLRRKRMSHEFIERHGEDLLQQALFEYIRTIRGGKEIRKPVAWIVLCAWHRTIRELESRDWRPGMVSTERVGELSADATPTPDEELLSEERYRKIREAVERLPEYQRQLLSLSYFEGESVREAARKLGWTASKAQRAHEAAQRRLHKILGVESSDQLEIVAGLAAFLSFGPDGSARSLQVIGGFEGAADTVVHHASQLGERGLDLVRRPFENAGPGGRAPASGSAEALSDLGRRALADGHQGPVALVARTGRRVSDLGRRMLASGGVETTTAAADGGARFAEACKAIAVACVIGTGAVTGGAALLGSDHNPGPARALHPQAAASRQGPADLTAAKLPESDSVSVAAGTASPVQDSPVSSTEPSAAAAPRVSTADGAAPTTPAQRRAQKHQSEEASAEESFDGLSKATAEAEAPTETAGSQAVSSGEAETLSSGGETTSSAPATPKVQAEEKQTKTQFQGGLP